MPYDKVKQKVVEACPDILKLGFGCEVITNKWNYDGSHEIITGTDHAEKVGFECVFRGKELIYAHEIQEILGREITIVDVLRAMKLTGHPFEGIQVIGDEMKITVPNGEVTHFVDENGAGENYEWSEINWNLAEDSLSWHRDNRPEVISFLEEILK